MFSPVNFICTRKLYPISSSDVNYQTTTTLNMSSLIVGVIYPISALNKIEVALFNVRLGVAFFLDLLYKYQIICMIPFSVSF